MTNEANEPRAKVGVWFKKSSTKDGGEGYEIWVGEGAEEGEATRVMALAQRLRNEAVATLKTPVTPRDEMVDQLEASIAAGGKGR